MVISAVGMNREGYRVAFPQRNPRSPQLLTQRLLLQQCNRHPLKKTELIAIARRREAILAGTVEPMYAKSPGLCRKCGFRKECRPHLRHHE